MFKTCLRNAGVNRPQIMFLSNAQFGLVVIMWLLEINFFVMKLLIDTFQNGYFKLLLASLSWLLVLAHNLINSFYNNETATKRRIFGSRYKFYWLWKQTFQLVQHIYQKLFLLFC